MRLWMSYWRHIMEDNQMKDVIRDFLKAWTRGEIEKAASYFADDAVWIAPQGTFKGKDQIKKYADWCLQVIDNLAVIQTGTGILTSGNTAVIEAVVSSGPSGSLWKVPSVTVIDFKDGKIISFRNHMDMLSHAQQTLSDGPGKEAVDTILSITHNGL